jgi:hypothetical protein
VIVRAVNNSVAVDFAADSAEETPYATNYLESPQPQSEKCYRYEVHAFNDTDQKPNEETLSNAEAIVLGRKIFTHGVDSNALLVTTNSSDDGDGVALNWVNLFRDRSTTTEAELMGFCQSAHKSWNATYEGGITVSQSLNTFISIINKFLKKIGAGGLVSTQT